MSMIKDDEYLPLRDVVFNTLRQEILTGKLKPGERLMEIHLANKLGVSRTPIREAIRKLELEGLVIMIPRRGAEVAQITLKSLQDVMEVRRALDVLAIELPVSAWSRMRWTVSIRRVRISTQLSRRRIRESLRRRMWHFMTRSQSRSFHWRCPRSSW